jgi:hypothetical protein
MKRREAARCEPGHAILQGGRLGRRARGAGARAHVRAHRDWERGSFRSRADHRSAKRSPEKGLAPFRPDEALHENEIEPAVELAADLSQAPRPLEAEPLVEAE